ncbi:disaggregatase related repeat-containing protein [Methanolobus sp. ZRKC2]|uniref:disaggregatase related repeat-containing protein n=1 Tax=Methanolobus sp. ZRKC2 TaxID=3125783 RepID=UPI003255BCE5
MTKNVLIGLLVLLCIGIPFAQGIPSSASAISVATDGNGDYNCDGIADQVQINAALKYAKNNNLDTVYLKSGTYTIDDSIEIPDGMTLTGDSDTTVKLIEDWDVTRSDMFTPMITGTTVVTGNYKGGSDITISGFTLDGSKFDQDVISAMKEVDSFPGIQFYYSDHITIENMVIKEIPGDGIRISNGRGKTANGYHKILNNVIYDTGHDDVFIMYGNYDVIDGNTLSRISHDCGIRLDDSANVLVTNNVIKADKNALYGLSGIYLLKHENDADSYNVTIAYNTIYDTREMGIVLAIGQGANYMPATSARDIHIHHNTIYGAGTNYRSYPYGGGIWLDGWDNTIIENNVIDGCMGEGIAYGSRFSNTQNAVYTTIVRNNIITNTLDSPVIPNDGFGINNRLGSNYRFVLENNVVWNNENGNYNNVGSHDTDINADPLFADSANRDYHLKSVAGRWSDNRWVTDTASSPAIDAGKTVSDYSSEPEPNGNRVNIGRYGNTAEASRSGSEKPEEPTEAVVYDNRLREGSPDAVLAESRYVDIGHLSGVGRYRDVMWFDLSEYKDTDTIKSATLSLYWYYPTNSRDSDTIIEIYRPAEWDPAYVSWNNREKSTPWNNAGGDWFDKNGVAQGSEPYASITFSASDLPDNRYYELDVTELVQDYVNGEYDNTGFFLKARDENNNYIAFYSSEWSNQDQKPQLNIDNTATSNTAPEYDEIPAISVSEENTISFTVNAIDADGDELSYSCTSMPEGATFNEDTATFSWTPEEGSAGNYEAVFAVTDGDLSDSIAVSITVSPLNRAPIINLFKPVDAEVFEEGSTVNINVGAIDAENDPLSYTIAIDGSQVSTSTTYEWYLDYSSAGSHTIEVTVSDGVSTVTSSHTVSVTDLHPRWDVNEDGIVNITDITLICQDSDPATTFHPRCDVNQDGVVDIQDVSIVVSHFGETVN